MGAPPSDFKWARRLATCLLSLCTSMNGFRRSMPHGWHSMRGRSLAIKPRHDFAQVQQRRHCCNIQSATGTRKGAKAMHMRDIRRASAYQCECAMHQHMLKTRARAKHTQAAMHTAQGECLPHLGLPCHSLLKCTCIMYLESMSYAQVRTSMHMQRRQ
jgi:hypothetical protein